VHFTSVFVCNAEHCTTKLGGHQSICQMPSPHIISLIVTPPWKSIGNIFCVTHGDPGLDKSLTLLGWQTWTPTQGWKELTRSSLCDSSFMPSKKLALHLAKPNTSSSSKWEVYVVNEDPKVQLATVVTSLETSLEKWAFLKRNSFILGSFPKGTPCK